MNLIVLPIIDSTNNYAVSLIEKGAADHNTVVLAYEQTLGKGQRGNNWESSPGMGLYASFIFRPQNIVAQQQFLLNKAISSGVSSFIEDRIKQPCFIKWPNDILIEDKKVSGILIENSLRGSQIVATVVGIGINLNQFRFLNEFSDTACSLRMLTGLSYDPESEIIILNNCINFFYEQFLAGNTSFIEDYYNKHLYRAGIESEFLSSTEQFSAVLESVENNGAAILNRNGERIEAIHPTIRFKIKRN